jgi:UDP-N-acetylglucosamine--N-acetylmuramyl-(pentapeptide) pyrophosphoryl-undecaprenol N-acetylglucosamine transferase
MRPGPIVLAAGGTGGHIFPAEALARELVARGGEVALVTDRRGQAFGDRVPGVQTYRIHAGRFGGGVVAKVIGVAELMLGIVESARRLRQLEASAVVGFGGYPSVPTLIAASRMGLPTVIHEQNALLGKANRLLAPRVRWIATSFREVERVRPEDHAKLAFTGNPVRPTIAALRDTPYLAPSGHEPVNILVLGGSQGARVFSEVIPAALGRASEALRRRIRISQQARPEDIEAARAAYAEARIEAELQTFFEDVPARLAAAQLVIARAGASTMTELTTVGRPAVLVPYPHAADDHQTSNAHAFAAAGAGWLVPQPDFTPEALARLLRELVDDPARLAGAAAASRDFGTPDAAMNLADVVVAAIDESNGSSSPVVRKTAA